LVRVVLEQYQVVLRQQMEIIQYSQQLHQLVAVLEVDIQPIAQAYLVALEVVVL
jgi:hypothetical protein